MAPSWLALHGAVNHFPLAMLLAAAGFEAGGLLLRKPEWRIVSFWMLAVAVAAAVPTLLTGWLSARTLFSPGRAPRLFDLHWKLGVAASILGVLWLGWRVALHDRLERGVQALTLLLAVAAAGTVGFAGYLGGEMLLGSPAQPQAAQPQATHTVSPTPSRAAVDPKLAAAGRDLFAGYKCQACHRMEGVGANAAPDLTHEAERHADMDWHIRHLKDPAKVVPGSAMPPFADLPPEELRALAAYLSTRR